MARVWAGHQNMGAKLCSVSAAQSPDTTSSGTTRYHTGQLSFWEDVLRYYGTNASNGERQQIHSCDHRCLHQVGGGLSPTKHHRRNNGCLSGKWSGMPLWGSCCYPQWPRCKSLWWRGSFYVPLARHTADENISLPPTRKRTSGAVQQICSGYLGKGCQGWSEGLGPSLATGPVCLSNFSTGIHGVYTILMWCNICWVMYHNTRIESLTEYKKVMKSLKITDETVTWLDCMNMYISL